MIETERLLIRAYHQTDAAVFFYLLRQNRDRLSDDFFNMVQTNTSELAVKGYFLQKSKDWQEHKGYACGIFLKENQQLIGHISVRDIIWKVPKGELAYFVFQPYTGHGYGSEALLAFRDWCFKEKKFNRLYMKIAAENTASCQVAMQCGFVPEGLLKKDYRRRGEHLTDMKLFAYTID